MASNEMSQSDVNYLLDGYRKRGLSPEILELAENDLKRGLSKYQVEIYAAKKVGIANAKAVSEAFQKGATTKFAHRILGLDEYRLDIVMKEFRNGMSEEKILDVLSRDAPVHSLQELFDSVEDDMAMAEDETEVNDDRPGNVEDKSEVAEDTPAVMPTISPDDIAKAMEPMLTRLMDGRLNTEIDRLERRVSELQGDLASSAGVIKSKEDEIIRLKEEMEKMKEKNEPRDAPVTDTSAGAGTHVDETILSAETNGTTKEDYLRAMEAKIKAEAMRDKDTENKYPAGGSYQTYLTTPDGKIIPVEIEHTKSRRPKGMLSMMSHLFKGTPSQKALLNMLIDSRLKPEQLKEIKRAKDHHFSDEELKDLIESDLPAEEMAGIIDVIMADR